MLCIVLHCEIKSCYENEAKQPGPELQSSTNVPKGPVFGVAWSLPPVLCFPFRWSLFIVRGRGPVPQLGGKVG